jgi:hypothetical protein
MVGVFERLFVSALDPHQLSHELERWILSD